MDFSPSDSLLFVLFLSKMDGQTGGYGVARFANVWVWKRQKSAMKESYLMSSSLEMVKRKSF